ncbi:tyrosine-type recombinase/integrase [Burkholderia cepacia]|uniref:tyrosine-type recombinase/integrase n=1 Tax=Burkholderia cepacia TaxID=292 RepID=UPI0034571FF1
MTGLGVRAEGRVFNYTSNGFKSAWRTLVKRCDIDDLHFHDLRHEAVSRLFELGTLDMMEVATISGHKSMQMLKRYTHLKAANLVAKIDGRRTLNRGRRVVNEAVVPYPAIIRQAGNQVTLQFVDFSHLRVEGTDANEVAARARDVLLRELVTAVKESRRPPTPTRSVESDGAYRAIVICPL